jgi:hypothetical protein
MSKCIKRDAARLEFNEPHLSGANWETVSLELCGTSGNSLLPNWATNVTDISVYQLTQPLLKAFRSSLPSIEEIEAELAGELGDEHE